jgi:hypothetical protein
MNEPAPLAPFRYPQSTPTRRHGPRGYTDPQRFKPWLRDEFTFRCVYCLCRERWCPDGEDAFGVEHFEPKALAPAEICHYDNLFYACCRCNAAKRELTGLLNPAEVPLAEHLEISADGTIHGLTPQGADLIRVCQLDRANLTEFRRGIFEVLRALDQLPEETRQKLLSRYFGFPANLPRLSTLRPPGGNTRPAGIADSCHARRQRGELPEYY